MAVSARSRLLVCAVLAVACAVLAGARVAPLGPALAIEVLPRQSRESFDLYLVSVTATGGETIERVVLEPLRGSVRVHPPGRTADLGPGVTYRAFVSVASDSPVPPAVRVLQSGRVSRHYDVELAPAAERR